MAVEEEQMSAEAKTLAMRAQAPLEQEPSQSTAIIQVIERAARDINVDVDKMERLLAMQERIFAQQAKAAYHDAMRRLKPLLPVVERKGRITIRDKNNTEKIIHSTPYALWEDIDTLITPILFDHGFSLTFKSRTADDGKLIITAVLTHTADGAVISHTEEVDAPPLPYDSTGSKNSVQAGGSTTKYGMRYAATLALNIRTKGEDDDGAAGGGDLMISEEQQEQLALLALDVKADLRKFCAYMKVKELSELPASRFDAAVQALESKRKKQ
jgi:hypothetical protein